jgi:hypothetical protein
VQVNAQPASSVSPSTDTTLVLTVTPAANGAWSVDLSIANNDPDENPYNWTISGTAVASYTVSYLANSATSGSVPGYQTKIHGVDLSLAENSGNLARTGYIFSGWNTAADGAGTSYAAGAAYTANAAAVLYARWLTSFERWVEDTGGDEDVSGQGVGGGGVTFSGDSNNDGVADGLAWLLGVGSPSENAAGNLPVPQQHNGAISVSFNYRAPVARGAANLRLQYSTTLAADSWTSVEIPEQNGTVDGVEFVINPVANTDLLDIQATVPSSAANGGGKVFVRLVGEVSSP